MTSLKILIIVFFAFIFSLRQKVSLKAVKICFDEFSYSLYDVQVKFKSYLGKESPFHDPPNQATEKQKIADKWVQTNKNRLA